MWYFRGQHLATVANGGLYEVEDLYDDGWFTWAGRPPRIISRVGRPRVTHWPDQRKVGLGLVVAADNVGTFETRLMTLRALVGSDVGVLRHELKNGWVLEMQARLNNWDLRTESDLVAKVSLEFISVEEPFFRRVTPEAATDAQVAEDESTVDFVHHNPGLTDRGMVIRFRGPVTDPTLWNFTLGPDGELYFGYQGSIPENDYIEFAVGSRTARWKNGNEADATRIVHSGDKYWFVLANGDNVLRYGGSGVEPAAVTIIQQPPF